MGKGRLPTRTPCPVLTRAQVGGLTETGRGPWGRWRVPPAWLYCPGRWHLGSFPGAGEWSGRHVGVEHVAQ